MGYHLRTPERLWSPENANPRTAGVVSGSRYYSPALGRWLSRDSLGEVGGANLLVFVENSPCATVDPIGLAPGAADYAPSLHAIAPYPLSGAQTLVDMAKGAGALAPYAGYLVSVLLEAKLNGPEPRGMTSVPLGDLEMPERLPDLVVDHLPQGPCQPPQVVWPWRTEVAQRFRVVRRVQQDGSGVRRLIVSVVVPLHLHRCECICMRPPTLALSVGPAGIWEWSCDYRHSHDFEILRFREVRQ